MIKLICLILISTISAFAQSGGNFTLTQTVIAGGGSSVAGGAFALDATSGQSLAGNALSGAPFGLTYGFWNTTVAPTAAQVVVGGRVTTVDGSGVRSVRVTLTAPNGSTQTAVTAAFGYFRFENVEVGETYIIAVFAKRYSFSEPMRVLHVLDAVDNLNFVADSQ